MSQDYDFWNVDARKLNTIAQPKFIGFTSPEESVTFVGAGLDQSRDKKVFPKSLFHAQLQLRLYRHAVWSSSGEENSQPLALIDNKNHTFWQPSAGNNNHWFVLDFGHIRNER